jgi:hypothetical protein
VIAIVKPMLAAPRNNSPKSAFVKLRLLSMSSRILAMPLSQDEETQIIAKAYEAVALLDKANSSMN